MAHKPPMRRKGSSRRLVSARSCSRRTLRDLDDMKVAANLDYDGVGFRTTALIGRGCQVQLPTVPLAGHQRIVLDDRLLKCSHVALTGFNRGSEHCLILNGGVVLGDSGSRGTIKRARPAARCRIRAVSCA